MPFSRPQAAVLARRLRTGIRELHALLTEAGIPHVYYESPGTDHEWQT